MSSAPASASGAPPKTGSQALLEALHERGVEVCFANPGTTEMWLVAALDATPGIRPLLGLHETVCAGAADGYARVKRKPACTVRDASFELPTDEEAITDSAPVRSARSSCTSVQASPTRSPTCTTRDAPTRPS